MAIWGWSDPPVPPADPSDGHRPRSQPIGGHRPAGSGRRDGRRTAASRSRHRGRRPRPRRGARRAAGVRACATPITTCAACPSVVLGHEGAGVVRRSGRGVTVGRSRRPRAADLGAPVRPLLPVHRGQPAPVRAPGSPLTAGHGRGPRRRARAAPAAASRGRSRSARWRRTTLVRREAVVPLPDDVPFTSACIVGCGVMTGYGSAVNAAKVRAGLVGGRARLRRRRPQRDPGGADQRRRRDHRRRPRRPTGASMALAVRRHRRRSGPTADDAGLREVGGSGRRR